MRSPIALALFAFAVGLLVGVLAPREITRCNLSCVVGEALYGYTSEASPASACCEAPAPAVRHSVSGNTIVDSFYCLPGETLYSYTSTVTGPSLACRAGAAPTDWRAVR